MEEAKLGTLSALQPYATEIGAGLALAAVLAAAVLWWFGGEPEPEYGSLESVADSEDEPASEARRELVLSRRP